MESWSNTGRSMRYAIVAVLIAAGIPEGGAAEAPAVPLVDVYFAEGALTLEPPAGTESKRHEVVTLFAGPTHTGSPAPWGEIEFPQPFTFSTDTVATFWIDPEEASIITSLRVELRSGEEVVAQGITGRIAGTSGENVLDGPRKVHLSIPTQGLTFAGTMNMRILYWGAALAGTPTTVHVLYGSESHPSRLSFGVAAGDVLLPASGHATTYYLDDEALTTIPPTGEESKTRTHGVVGAENLATSSAFTWGTFTTERDMDLVGDTTLTFWLTHSGDPALMRSVRPVVDIGGTEYTTSGGADAWPFSDGETYRFSIAFNTAGVQVPAGTEIRLDFLIWSTNSNEIGTIEYLYGSSAHPARLTFRAAGAPILVPPVIPDVAISADVATLRLEPGQTKTVNLSLVASANTTATVQAETDGPLTIGFPDGATLNLTGTGATLVPVTVRAGPAAIMNTSSELTFRAATPAGTHANATVTVEIVAPESGESGTGSGGTGTNETASDAQDGPEPDDVEGLPGPSAALLAVAALAVVALLARRRRAV